MVNFYIYYNTHTHTHTHTHINKKNNGILVLIGTEIYRFTSQINTASGTRLTTLILTLFHSFNQTVP